MKELIKNGLKTKTIKIIDDYGIRCKIGDYSFYFLGTDCDISIEEYNESHSEEMTAQMLTDILKTVESAEENGIDCVERDYYLSILGCKVD